jgi:galactosamine-6-phosphate isomerase
MKKEKKHGPDMNIQYCANYEQMSQLAYDSIITELKTPSNQFICIATGNSPIGTYEKLANCYKNEPDLFKEISILKLDEWGGIRLDDSISCETYIRQKILEPLQISDDRFISFKSNSDFPEKECERIQKEIEDNGPIDICILGLGTNGHLGFIEPANSLFPHCHVAKLSSESLQHNMLVSKINKPGYGLTLGMANILQSKKIILLITGTDKEIIIHNFLKGKITTKLPASFLWMHHNVDCYIDSESL